jgi:hypothetical protein
MSTQQWAQQQACGALLASQIPSITEETVRRSYHEHSAHYDCHGCGVAETKEKQYLQCSKCKQSRYCSKECQRSHWKEHKDICKLVCKHRSSKKAGSGSLTTQDCKERMELFNEKYTPMMQVATSWELKQSAEEMITIFELEDLPAECKAPRLGIKSFRQESIRSQPNSIQDYHTDCLNHRTHPSHTRTVFALLLWTHANSESTVSVLSFSFEGGVEDSGIFKAEGRGVLRSRAMQIGICHQEASKYVETINDMARGRKKNLSKAAKPRRR